MLAVDPGAPVRQWDCTGGANQKWAKVFDTATGKENMYYYRNINSGMCLEIGGANSTWNGATANQWPCNFGNNQAFYNSVYMPPMHTSGKCLEIADWRVDNGAPARQWDCTNGANQTWTQTKAG
nr:RICIN domain-containing protein [Streptomyces sp. TLI_235]